MQLFTALVISRVFAKTFDPGGEVQAFHFFGEGQSSQATFICLLEHAKFTYGHGFCWIFSVVKKWKAALMAYTDKATVNPHTGEAGVEGL
ncbi:MAG: hypothetical protein IPL01_08790 [Acidobacteria bacterium]|nr:hypothetical protein [Acidobacteriota bacterium]